MYHPQKLAIYLSSYHDGVGRKAGKTPSTSKLMGKWSVQVASVSFERVSRCPSLSGTPASIQAATKVNRCLSVVTKANDRTEFVGDREVEPVVAWRRLKSVWKQWLDAHTGSLGVKAGGMDTYTRAVTWDLPTGSSSTIPCVWKVRRISTQCENEGNAGLGKSDEAKVVMMPRTLQPRRSEVPLLLKTFPHRKGDA
jgi:hypothetical protein